MLKCDGMNRCLETHYFMNVTIARSMIEPWKRTPEEDVITLSLASVFLYQSFFGQLKTQCDEPRGSCEDRPIPTT